jgi:hypothetical protein
MDFVSSPELLIKAKDIGFIILKFIASILILFVPLTIGMSLLLSSLFFNLKHRLVYTVEIISARIQIYERYFGLESEKAKDSWQEALC